MDDELYVDLTLENAKVKFYAASSLRPERGITFDYVPPIGDGEGFLGLEVLLMSFDGCVGTTITALLRRMGNTVTRFAMRASARRRTNPLSLEKIHAVITLNAVGVNAEDVQKAIGQAAMLSPVWLAIRNNVEVTVDFELQ
jgi:uncharacterized OsmC-like protein